MTPDPTLRAQLDALGYDRVFRAIGDAVKIEYGTALSISVEKLVEGLSGVSREEAERLARKQYFLQACRTSFDDKMTLFGVAQADMDEEMLRAAVAWCAARLS